MLTSRLEFIRQLEAAVNDQRFFHVFRRPGVQVSKEDPSF